MQGTTSTTGPPGRKYFHDSSLCRCRVPQPQIGGEIQRMRFAHDLASSVHGNVKYEILREPRRLPADLRGHAFVGRVFSTRGEHEWFVGYVIVVGWMVHECAICGESCVLTRRTQLDRHSDFEIPVLTDQGFQRACTSGACATVRSYSLLCRCIRHLAACRAVDALDAAVLAQAHRSVRPVLRERVLSPRRRHRRSAHSSCRASRTIPGRPRSGHTLVGGAVGGR